MELSYSNFEDALGYFYDCAHEFTDAQFWKAMATVLKIADEETIPSLYTSQSFVLKVFKFLTALPYKKDSRRILELATSYLDPTPQLFKKIIHELVPCLQNQIPCLSTLNVCLAFYNSIFKQQNPTNENLDSHIYLYGSEEGMVVQQKLKWPFQKGGTLAFWYNMSDKTKECKIFQFLNEEKMGFEIVVRNKKIYIQKEEDETKFRLIKNTSSFLCDAIFNKNVKLCLEFEIKKKFFQPYLSINLIMNNFAINGVQIDSFPTGSSLFQIKLFKSFFGKFYSCLVMTDKLAQQVDELNSQKAFISESDIRNFTCLFQNSNENVLLLFSSIRSTTDVNCAVPSVPDSEIEDELKEPVYNITKPIRTLMEDAIGSHSAEIDSKSFSYHNWSIGKEIGNYGGFESFFPFIPLLQICCSQDELYVLALNQLLELVGVVFGSKADSIEKACQFEFFKLLAQFFERTKMQGFSYETITRLKQIYISLNTRMLREKFIEELVWGVNFGRHLGGQNFLSYIKLVKTFYNEDIQSSLHTFGITKIIHYIVQKLDIPQCCYDHTRSNLSTASRAKNYPQILSSLLEIIENIILIKRSEPDLEPIIGKVIEAFGLSISPCLIEALIHFLQQIFAKDQFIEKKFLQCLRADNLEGRFYLYKCLSCCSSWKAKGKIIQFILKLLEPNFFQDEKREREMVTLCARYPTMNYLRSSSIKSRSQENRDSMDYSEDKLSLNSATMHKLIVIDPIQSQDEILLDDFQTLEVIFGWAFSDKVVNLTAEDQENPGLLILMQLYKGATYRLREQMSGIIKQKMRLIRFSPELMAWAIQCSLIAEYDLSQVRGSKVEIQLTKENLIELISTYNFLNVEEEENNQISIIKLVFSSVKSKYPDDIVKVVGNKLFFIICERKMQMFAKQLKVHDHVDLADYDRLCTKIISNVLTFVNEYYVIRGDGDENEFDEDMAEITESENHVILSLMDNILQILVLVATVNDRRIIEEANAERNHAVINMLFPDKDKEKQRINIMFLLFGILQNIFDFFEDLDTEPKKKCLLLIKKYILYIMQLTQNSGSAKLEHLEEDLRSVFLLNLSFVEQKYSQYFYFPYDRHKNIDFQVESKIRKSIEEIKRAIFNIVLDLIQLTQYIDEKGDLEHKSFYELMKPKRKPVHKYALKHIYPAIWKKSDEKIKQFLCLKREVLRKQAQEKLEGHLIIKKISQSCADIEKSIAKKIFTFVETQRKQSDDRQKKSVSFYKISQSEKCRKFCECEEELIQHRLKILQQEKNYISKYRQLKNLQKRELRRIVKKLWNENRLFSGFWANENFYQFCQNEPMKSSNSLQKFYQRVRSRRQSKYFLMPFIKIQAREVGKKETSEEIEYASEAFMEGVMPSKTQKRILEIASDKFINGLQFIKRKVYSKLVKTMSVKEQPSMGNKDDKSRVFFVENALWVRPMRVCAGLLKIDAGKMSFCHKPTKNYQHISLLKNQLLQTDLPIKQWSLCSIEGFIMKRFLLKQNSIQFYLKTRKSVFLCFNDKSSEQYLRIVAQISTILSQATMRPDNLLLCTGDAIKSWETSELTQKWLNYELSNLEYLMCLNVASGRTNCDLNQYPVLPWVFSQYLETRFKKNEDKYRDFAKNMAQLGREERIKKFQQIYESLTVSYSQQFPVPHYFGFHYSNLPIVLQYLIRVNPYSAGAKTLQGGKFDIPDRLFYSIPESFKGATNEMSDLRELTPQFFYFPQFLINSEEFQFGSLQDQAKRINNVELPDGCLNAYDFIEHHREGLESRQVSLNIHKWIDLIFGYKNSGREADKHINTYHYLTHQANSQRIDSVEDAQEREAMESQMAYYGKTPSQVFSRAHPQRQPKPAHDFQLWDKIAFSVSENFGKLFKDQSKIVDSILSFCYCAKSKTYLLLGKHGKGMVFSLDRKQIIKINQFVVKYDKVEGVNIVQQIGKGELAVQYLEEQWVVMGGLWGGRLMLMSLAGTGYHLLFKHTAAVSALKYSHHYQLLFSGSGNGQLCKWAYCEKRLSFQQKVYCHARINSIQIDEDLKVVGACTEEGCLWILGVQKMDLIRTIKVQHSVVSFQFLRFPFYSLLLVCRNCHQYCYSINGTVLEEAEMETSGQAQVLQQDCSHQKILVRIGSDLIFLKAPELETQEKLEVGIGDSGFVFLANPHEIVVLNETQLLVWRRPADDYQQTVKFA